MDSEKVVQEIANDILCDIGDTYKNIIEAIKNYDVSNKNKVNISKLVNIMSDKLRLFDAILSLELKDEEEKRLYEKLNSMYTLSKDNGTDTSILSSLCDKISLSEKISEYIEEQLKELYN